MLSKIMLGLLVILVLFVIVSVLVAITLGVAIDAVAGWLSRRKTADSSAL